MNVRWSASNLTTPGGQTALVLPVVAACTAAIAVGVLWFGQPPTSDGARLALEIGVGAFVLFSLISVLVWSRTRASVALGWDGERLRLEVRAPGKPVVVYTGPFREEHCIVRGAVQTGHGGSISQLTLMLVLFDGEGRCVLLLRELLGAIYDAPAGWTERTIAAAGAQHVLVNSLGRSNLDQLALALGKSKS